MAIGNTFDSLQAAILAEEQQKLDAADSFRNYLVRQSANANQGRQVGVNQFDAETRRGLGYRNADEAAADRDARYGYLGQTLSENQRQFNEQQRWLREQLAKKAELDQATLDLKKWEATLRENQLDLDRQLRETLGKGQLDIYGKQLEVGQRPTEAFSAKAAELLADEEDKERRGTMLAQTLNAKSKGKVGWFTNADSARDKAWEEVSNGPLAKDLSLVKFNQASGMYEPAVRSADLRRALLESRNPRAGNQPVTLEPPKPASAADFTARRVGGRWVIGDGKGQEYQNLPAVGNPFDPTLVPPEAVNDGVAGVSGNESASPSRVLAGGTPDRPSPEKIQPMDARAGLAQEFRRRLAELERTPPGAAPLLAPMYSDVARRMSLDPARVGSSTMFRTPQNQVRRMANSPEMAAWEAGLTPEEWSALFRGAIAESYRNPNRGYDNFVFGQ